MNYFDWPRPRLLDFWCIWYGCWYERLLEEFGGLFEHEQLTSILQQLSWGKWRLIRHIFTQPGNLGMISWTFVGGIWFPSRHWISTDRHGNLINKNEKWIDKHESFMSDQRGNQHFNVPTSSTIYIPLTYISTYQWNLKHQEIDLDDQEIFCKISRVCDF